MRRNDYILIILRPNSRSADYKPNTSAGVPMTYKSTFKHQLQCHNPSLQPPFQLPTPHIRGLLISPQSFLYMSATVLLPSPRLTCPCVSHNTHRQLLATGAARQKSLVCSQQPFGRALPHASARPTHRSTRRSALCCVD